MYFGMGTLDDGDDYSGFDDTERFEKFTSRRGTKKPDTKSDSKHRSARREKEKMKQSLLLEAETKTGVTEVDIRGE